MMPVVDVAFCVCSFAPLHSTMMNFLRRFSLTFSILLALVSSELPSETADFDFYVYSMSFQPEFCYGHRSQHYSGCQQPLDYWKTHLTIHGMWPERRDGSWPASCSAEPLDETVVQELKDDLDLYWPNIKDAPDDPDYSEFWSHEWSKHGTCSGLSQKSYFQAALEHSLATPTIVGEHYGKSLSKTKLMEAYDNKVVPVCSKGRYLQEVRACYSMDPDGRPTTLVPCPAPVLKEGNCGDEIVISRFPQERNAIDLLGSESNLRGAAVATN